MEIFFQNIAVWIESSKYILLFLGCIVEGPVVMVTSGFLFRLGQFDLMPMYVALMAGDFTADIGWYCLGRYGTRHSIFRLGAYFNITPETIEKVEKLFQKYHQKILIISKLTMGFGFAVVVLIVAGMFKVKFKNYVILNLLGGFVWTALLLTAGYFFGNAYEMIPGWWKIAFATGGLLIFIFGMRYVNNYLKNFNKI